MPLAWSHAARGAWLGVSAALLAWTPGACDRPGATPVPAEASAPATAGPRRRASGRPARPGSAARACAPTVGAPLGPPPRWPGDPGLRRRVAPRPRLPPRSRYPVLLGLEALLRERGPAAARPAGRRLIEAGTLGPHPLAALVWSCPPCMEDVMVRLRRQAERSGWQWADAQELLPLCGHPREAVRAGALWTFGAAATHLALGPLRARLEFHLPVFRPLALDPSPWVRAEAVALLGHLRDRRAHALLTGLLVDPRPMVRVATVEAIARAVTLVPGAPTTRAVCQRLRDPSPTVRAAVLAALATAPGACPLTEIAALLGDRYRLRLRLLTREGGDRGLWRVGGEVRQAAWRALPAALRPSAPGLPWDLRVQDARAALATAGLVPAPMPTVAALAGPCRPALGSGGGPARLAAQRREAILAALAALEGQPLEAPLGSALLELLAHPAAEVRWRALTRLGQGSLDDQKGAVLGRARWLARWDAHPLVRREALATLVRWHAGPEVRRHVEAALGDAHPAVRLQAAQLLPGLDPARARARLPGLLGDGSGAVRAAAIYGLLRDPQAEVSAARVIRALDDAAGAQLGVAMGAGVIRLDPGFGSVRSAALMALEAVQGPRHRGTEAERARRWQDDLRLRARPRPAPR